MPAIPTFSGPEMVNAAERVLLRLTFFASAPHIADCPPMLFEVSMPRFDYDAPAELFTGRSIRGSRAVRYHRFDSGAEALRFAMETLPREHLLAAVLKVNEERYRHGEIQRFYEAKDYPLARKDAVTTTQRKPARERKSAPAHAAARG
jgi:hypothetical protein